MGGKKWTYERFIEEYGNVIEENEEEFNAIIAAEKAKEGKFDFKHCKFKFIFPGNKIELTMVYSWKKDKTKPPSERKADKKEKEKARQNDSENNNLALEKKSIKKLFEIIDEKQDSNMERKVVGLEGCHVDVATCINSGDEKLCPIQIKSSNAKIPIFKMTRYKCPEEFKGKYERFGYYENMLTICHNMKIDEYLIIPPHSNDKIPNTGLSYSSGVANGFGVEKDEIYDIIVKYINDYSTILGKSYRELQLLCNEKCRFEVEHIHLRIDTFSNIFDMKELSGGAVDFIIDDYINVQEKTKNYTDVYGNSFTFHMQKCDGHDKKQPYTIDDNDFYWFNLAGTKYFYVIPSNLLEEMNGGELKIRTDLRLHKEFKTQEENTRFNYNDTWTYDFRFDRTKIDDINRLWNLIYFAVL